MTNVDQKKFSMFDYKERLLKADSFMIRRYALLDMISAIESKFGRSGRDFSLAMDKLRDEHMEFCSYLEWVRSDQTIIDAFTNEGDLANIPIMNYILVHGKIPHDAVLEQIFITLYEKRYINIIDKYTENMNDQGLKDKLLKIKYLSFLLNPELEGMYLGIDSVVDGKKSNLERFLTGDKAKEFANRQLNNLMAECQKQNKIDEEIVNAIRLLALTPFLEKQDEEMVLDKTKNTLNSLSVDVTKLLFER